MSKTRIIEVMGRRNSANVQKVMWTLGELGLDDGRHCADVGASRGDRGQAGLRLSRILDRKRRLRFSHGSRDRGFIGRRDGSSGGIFSRWKRRIHFDFLGGPPK